MVVKAEEVRETLAPTLPRCLPHFFCHQQLAFEGEEQDVLGQANNLSEKIIGNHHHGTMALIIKEIQLLLPLFVGSVIRNKIQKKDHSTFTNIYDYLMRNKSHKNSYNQQRFSLPCACY